MATVLVAQHPQRPLPPPPMLASTVNDLSANIPIQTLPSSSSSSSESSAPPSTPQLDIHHRLHAIKTRKSHEEDVAPLGATLLADDSSKSELTADQVHLDRTPSLTNSDVSSSSSSALETRSPPPSTPLLSSPTLPPPISLLSPSSPTAATTMMTKTTATATMTLSAPADRSRPIGVEIQVRSPMEDELMRQREEGRQVNVAIFQRDALDGDHLGGLGSVESKKSKRTGGLGMGPGETERRLAQPIRGHSDLSMPPSLTATPSGGSFSAVAHTLPRASAGKNTGSTTASSTSNASAPSKSAFPPSPSSRRRPIGSSSTPTRTPYLSLRTYFRITLATLLTQQPHLFTTYILPQLRWGDFHSLGLTSLLIRNAIWNDRTKEAVLAYFVPPIAVALRLRDPTWTWNDGVNVNFQEMCMLMMSMNYPVHHYPMHALSVLSKTPTPMEEATTALLQQLTQSHSRLVLLLQSMVHSSSSPVPSDLEESRWKAVAPVAPAGLRELTFPEPLAYFDREGESEEEPEPEQDGRNRRAGGRRSLSVSRSSAQGHGNLKPRSASTTRHKTPNPNVYGYAYSRYDTRSHSRSSWDGSTEPTKPKRRLSIFGGGGKKIPPPPALPTPASLQIYSNWRRHGGNESHGNFNSLKPPKRRFVEANGSSDSSVGSLRSSSLHGSGLSGLSGLSGGSGRTRCPTPNSHLNPFGHHHHAHGNVNISAHDLSLATSRNRAPILRVFVPCGTLSDSLIACERQLIECGLWSHLSEGDVVCNFGYVPPFEGDETVREVLSDRDRDGIDSGSVSTGSRDYARVAAVIQKQLPITDPENERRWLIFGHNRLSVFDARSPAPVRDAIHMPSPFYYQHILPRAVNPTFVLRVPDLISKVGEAGTGANGVVGKKGVDYRLTTMEQTVPSPHSTKGRVKVKKFVWLARVPIPSPYQQLQTQGAEAEDVDYGIGDGWRAEWVVQGEGTKEGKLVLEELVSGKGGERVFEVVSEKCGKGRLWLRLETSKDDVKDGEQQQQDNYQPGQQQQVTKPQIQIELPSKQYLTPLSFTPQQSRQPSPPGSSLGHGLANGNGQHLKHSSSASSSTSRVSASANSASSQQQQQKNHYSAPPSVPTAQVTRAPSQPQSYQLPPPQPQQYQLPSPPQLPPHPHHVQQQQMLASPTPTRTSSLQPLQHRASLQPHQLRSYHSSSPLPQPQTVTPPINGQQASHSHPRRQSQQPEYLHQMPMPPTPHHSSRTKLPSHSRSRSAVEGGDAVRDRLLPLPPVPSPSPQPHLNGHANGHAHAHHTPHLPPRPESQSHSRPLPESPSYPPRTSSKHHSMQTFSHAHMQPQVTPLNQRQLQHFQRSQELTRQYSSTFGGAGQQLHSVSAHGHGSDRVEGKRSEERMRVGRARSEREKGVHGHAAPPSAFVNHAGRRDLVG